MTKQTETFAEPARERFEKWLEPQLERLDEFEIREADTHEYLSDLRSFACKLAQDAWQAAQPTAEMKAQAARQIAHLAKWHLMPTADEVLDILNDTFGGSR